MEFLISIVVLGLLIFGVVIPLWALRRTFTIEGELNIKLASLEAKLRRMEEAWGKKRIPDEKPRETEEEGPEVEKVSIRPVAEERTVPNRVRETVRKVEIPEREMPRSMVSKKVEGMNVSLATAKENTTTPEWKKKWDRFIKTVDWEQFTGVKLFAWLGGLALFCGAAFFVKYSIDRNLIPPALRLAIGSLTSIGLLVASLKIDRKRYETTGDILAAGGIGVLYTVVFAAAHLYHYIPNTVGIVLLALVSLSAFVLSVRLEGVSISTLGALGAYAAPILLNTGHANLPGLFVYLAIVDIGVFEVVRRLAAPKLFMLSTVATLLLLSLGAWGATPQAEPSIVTGIGAALLVLFSVFFDRMPKSLVPTGAIRGAARILFGGMLCWSFALLQQTGPYPIVLVTVGMILAIVLGLKVEAWSNKVLLYGLLSFGVALAWILFRFETKEVSWDFLCLFLYGLTAGLGPILLVKKYGLKTETLNWFTVFPAGSLVLTLMVLSRDPETSFWLWPIVLGFHAMGLFLGILVGQTMVVGVLAVLTLVNALLWILRAPVMEFGFGFHVFLLVGGAALCVATLWLLKRLPSMAGSFGFETKKGRTLSGIQAEWLSSLPVLGSFFLLGTVFFIQTPLSPNPGMVVGLCFLVVALGLGRRIESETLMMTALGAAVVSQACWMLRVVNGSDPLHFDVVLWTGGLWLAALIAPFVFFRPLKKQPKVWCAWALFELAQAVLFLRSAGALWTQDVMGWFPIVLCLLKVLFVRDLLVRLKDRVERNVILAFHGGVLLFYLSALPVLLLDHGWLGLTLVFEAMALLWLNRRIGHPGLPWVATVAAPVGLALLMPALHQLRAEDSMPVLNLAVGAVALAVAALWGAVYLAPTEKREFPFRAFFIWLAIGSGFFLLNLVVADLFGGPHAKFRFFSEDDVVQYLVYSLLWSVFGAVLWKTKALPRGLRWVGVLLVFLGWGRVLIFPPAYPHSVGAMHPLLNLGLPVYGALVLILVFLIRTRDPEDHRGVTTFFTALLVVMGFFALTTECGIVFQPEDAWNCLAGHNSGMALTTCLGWFLYGLGTYLWPWRLEKPFHSAGVLLTLVSIIKTMDYPLVHSVEFGAMTPVFNLPTLLFVGMVLVLVALTLRDPGERWPLSKPGYRVFWGIVLGLFAFFTLNVLTVEVFGVGGHPFGFETFGSFSHQLAYSLGWLLYAITLLWVGIRWKVSQVRWTALGLFFLTALKIFFMDLWSLGQLYRVASFIGLASVLILVSYLYQRFLSGEKKA